MITIGTPLLEQSVTVSILTEVAKSIRENWHKLYGKDRFYD